MKRTLRISGWSLAGLYALQLLTCFISRVHDEVEEMRRIPAPGGDVRVSLHRHHMALDLIPGIGAFRMLAEATFDPWPRVELRITRGDWQHSTLVERPDAHFRGWDSMFARQQPDGTLELVVPPDDLYKKERVLFRIYTAAGFPTP